MTSSANIENLYSNKDTNYFENIFVTNSSFQEADHLETNQENSHVERKKEVIFKILKIKKINNWTEKEDKLLRDLVDDSKMKNWKEVAEFFPGKSPIQCSSRYRRVKPGILKGYWTKEEDIKLIENFQKFGKNWKLIAKAMHNRTGKQIRDRYLNSLNPELNKKKFNLKEDQLLVSLYNDLGPAWSKICKCFNGRSGDMVKNRFFYLIKKGIIPLSPNMKFKKRVLLNAIRSENNRKNNSKTFKIKGNQKINETDKILNKEEITDANENKEDYLNSINLFEFMNMQNQIKMINLENNNKNELFLQTKNGHINFM